MGGWQCKKAGLGEGVEVLDFEGLRGRVIARENGGSRDCFGEDGKRSKGD